jgi:hypothetical protein
MLILIEAPAVTQLYWIWRLVCIQVGSGSKQANHCVVVQGVKGTECS